MKLIKIVVTVLVFFISVHAPPGWAQPSSIITYDNRLTKPAFITALGTDLFGEQFDLQEGGMTFTQDDVEIPTNSKDLKLTFGRKSSSSNQGFDVPFAVFGSGWEPNLPFMMSTHDDRLNWEGEAPAENGRCSRIASPTRLPGINPYNPANYYVTPDMYWNGITLNIPGIGEQKLLKINAAQILPADGAIYTATTRSKIRISCLPALKNGPGEGYIAHLPNGTKYYFDWMAVRDAWDLTANGYDRYRPGETSVLIRLNDIFLFATKIVDRFGNQITYEYDASYPQRLKSITSSEGGSLAISYEGGLVRTVTHGDRTWTYSYRPPSTIHSSLSELDRVIRPDGSEWKFQGPVPRGGNGGTAVIFWQQCRRLIGAMTSSLPPDPATLSTFRISHPSGAEGAFHFRPLLMGTNNAPGGCTAGRGLDPGGVFGVPSVHAKSSLYRKEVTGPGLSPLSWDLFYQPTWSFESECAMGCASTSTTTVTSGDGVRRSYIFGNRYDTNAGQLLAETVEQGGAIRMRTDYSYATSATGFPNNAGEIIASPYEPSLYGNPFTTLNRPMVKTSITADGTRFESTVILFDEFMRPIKEEKKTFPAP